MAGVSPDRLPGLLGRGAIVGEAADPLVPSRPFDAGPLVVEFGEGRFGQTVHWLAAVMVFLGTWLSGFFIIVSNAWMQNPVGSAFNPDTMRMEVTDFMAVMFNPVAQAKFVHTVSAGYVCAATFVLGVSAWYLLRGRHVQLAKRSFVIASALSLSTSATARSRASLSTPEISCPGWSPEARLVIQQAGGENGVGEGLCDQFMAGVVRVDVALEDVGEQEFAAGER